MAGSLDRSETAVKFRPMSLRTLARGLATTGVAVAIGIGAAAISYWRVSTVPPKKFVEVLSEVAQIFV